MTILKVFPCSVLHHLPVTVQAGCMCLFTFQAGGFQHTSGAVLLVVCKVLSEQAKEGHACADTFFLFHNQHIAKACPLLVLKSNYLMHSCFLSLPPTPHNHKITHLFTLSCTHTHTCTHLHTLLMRRNTQASSAWQVPSQTCSLPRDAHIHSLIRKHSHTHKLTHAFHLPDLLTPTNHTRTGCRGLARA